MEINQQDLREYGVRILHPNSDDLSGTGFFCNPEGLILTCYHVIEPYLERNIEKVNVCCAGEDVPRQAGIKECLELPDLAVLQLVGDNKSIKYLPLDIYNRWKRGDICHSFGHPAGFYEEPGRHVEGNIVGPTREGDTPTVEISGLSISAVQRGYSGSPVISTRTNKVIGLITSRDIIANDIAAFVPITPLFQKYGDIKKFDDEYKNKEFHDVYKKIRLALADWTEEELTQKLRNSEFIPLSLECGKKPEERDGGEIPGTGIHEWGHGRSWEDFNLKNLDPPSESYILSSSVGMGKTTFLLWLSTHLGRKYDVVAPFITCADFEEWNPSSWNTLQEKIVEKCSDFVIVGAQKNFYVNRVDIEDFFSYFFETNKIVFLFDGLDQISDQTSPSQIAEKMFQTTGQNKVIISSRPSAAFPIEGDFNRTFLRLKPYSVNDEKRYFGEYYNNSRSICSYAPHLTKIPMLAFMVKNLLENKNIADIANRTDLYNRFVSSIIREHGIHGINSAGRATGVRRDLQLISYFSLSEDLPLIQKISANYVGNHLDEDSMDRLPQMGPINLILERGEHYFFYTHQSFQEYLAAEFITRRNNTQYFERVFSERWNPKWKEVIKFVAGIQGNEFIELLLRQEDNIIHSNLFLMAECAPEVRAIDFNNWKEILQKIESINDAFPKSRSIEALSSLARTSGIGQDNTNNIIDTIINHLRDPDGDVRSAAVKVLGNLSEKVDQETLRAIAKRLEDTNRGVRSAAAGALRNLSEKVDQETLRAIAKLLEDTDEDVRSAALNALGELSEKLDQETVNAIAKRLEDTDWIVRYEAVRVLFWKLSEKVDQETVNAIVKRLEVPDEEVRTAAVHALGAQSEKVNQETVNAIVKRLEVPDEEVRTAAVDALGELSEKVDQKTVNAIAKRLEDTDADVRGAAVRALGKLSEKVDQKTVNAIVKRMEVPDRNVRTAAVDALGELSEKVDQKTVNAIAKLLEDTDEDVRGAAVRALGKLSEKVDQETVSAIAKRLEDTSILVRIDSAHALEAQSEKVNQETVNAIVKRMEDTNRSRFAAVYALRKLSEKVDQKTVNAIAKRLEDTNAEVRGAAVEALGELSEKVDQKTVNAIAKRLEDTAGIVRYKAVRALGELSEKVDQKTVCDIVKRLEDTDIGVQNAAVDALGELSEKVDQETLRAIGKLLEDTDSDVRYAAAKALRNLSEKVDQETVRTIAKLLGDTYWQVRYAAAKALRNLSEKVDQETVRAIAKLLEDTDSDVRSAAVKALERLYQKNGSKMYANP